MARKRMIDPSFWVDEKLGTVSPLVRLLFMGLISQADDEGRLNGHPALIRSLIFAYDVSITVADVEEWLGLLAAPERKLIIRYEVDHQKYILIPNFKKHQTINKPQPSKLPEPLPDNYGSDTVTVDDGYRLKEEKLKEEKLKEEKGIESEEKVSAHTVNIRDSITNLLNQCKVQGYTLFSIDILTSYVGVMEYGVIEAAIKKAQGKHVNYAVNTIESWKSEGKTTVASILPKQNKPQKLAQSGKPKGPVYKAPKVELTPEERAELNRYIEEQESNNNLPRAAGFGDDDDRPF